jgi:hypothetical protein
MGDLTRIDQAQAIEITDGVSQTATIATGLPGGSVAGLVVREAAQGQQTAANSRPVVIASDQSDINVDINGTAITSATCTNVTASNVTSTQLLASNTSRRMAMFHNDSSTNSVWIKFGTTASATSFTVELQPHALFELPVPVYCGAIEALGNGATVTVRVTEM